MKNTMQNKALILKTIKKYLNRISGILGALIIFILITDVLNYMYVNVEEIRLPRILFHYYYEDEGKIDNIYLGSSHVYSDINPMQLDEINGEYNFDLATSSQRLNGSYYLLKEADRNNSLSHVYLDLYYTFIVKTGIDLDSDPINEAQHWNWQNTDYMKNSFNKLEYMFSIAGVEKYTDIFLPFSRYRANLDNWDYINKVIEEKNSDNYLAYIHHTDYDNGTYSEYIRQGYLYSTKEITNEKKMRYKSGGLGEDPMGEESKEYLYKIINYCKKRDIPITLFVTPIKDFQLINLNSYDNYIDQVRGIAKECGVDFYDFNLAKSEYFSLDSIKDFRDFTHLNTAGAKVFTDFFAKVVSGTASENEKYFYSSYAEKLQREPPRIYGLYYQDANNNEIAEDEEVVSDLENIETADGQIRTLWIASNRESGMEYKIVMTSDEGEQYIVQDFSENKEFTLSTDEHGICTILARMKDDPEEIQTLEISY